MSQPLPLIFPEDPHCPSICSPLLPINCFPLLAFALGTAEAGIRKANRRDLTLIELAPGSRVAGGFHAKPLLCGAGADLQGASWRRALSVRW